MLYALLLTAALASEPAWTVDLGEGGALPFAAPGAILVWLPQDVVSLDPSTGDELWRRPHGGALRGDLFGPVPGSPVVLLSRFTADGTGFDLVDARSGDVRWTAPDGRVVLGAYHHDGSVLVVWDLAEEPGRLGLTRVDLSEGEVWTVPDAIASPPPVVPVSPGRRGRAYTVRATPLPRFDEASVWTAWAPRDGVVRRDWSDGAVRWRLVLPLTGSTLPLEGFADPVLTGDLLLLPVEPDRVAALQAQGGLAWRRGRNKGPVQHLVVAGDTVASGGGDFVQAASLADGKRRWRVRVSPVDLAADGAGVVVLDSDGVAHRFGRDGEAVYDVAVREDDLQRAVGIVLRPDLDVVLLEAGAVGLDPTTGAVRWRVAGQPVADLSDPARRAPMEGPSAWTPEDLYRDVAGDPDAHWWVTRERSALGVAELVVHRTDLATGDDASVGLGASSPHWVRVGDVVAVFDYGGEIRAYALAGRGGTGSD